MHHHTFPTRPIAAAVSLALLTMGSAWAQSNPADASKDGMNFDQIVVTGTSTAKSKMKQSVSVSTLSAEQMEKTGVLISQTN